MRLYFLRHGDAELSGSDSDRNLTTEGITEAECASRAIRVLKLSFTAILSSPLVRARQTSDIVAKQFPTVSVQAFEHITPTSDPQNLFRELRSFPRDSRILLVSHEPFISHCIASLVSGIAEPRISIKKASLACVEVGSPIQRGAGIFLWLLTNEQMKLMNT
jgi:phosphohistidine phosphatase